MKQMLDRSARFLNTLFENLAIVCLVVVIIAMVVQVFTRYVMNASMTGTEELGRFFFIWATMLGASLCIPVGGHAVVNLLNDSLHGKIKQRHLAVIDVCIMVMAVLLLIQGGKMVAVTTRQLSPILRVPMCYIYLAIPFGSAGILINALNNFFKRFGAQ